MGSFSNTREIKEDVLFRASESLTNSDWNSKVMDYLNRVYRALCAGASEFLPEYVDDWWWMRKQGVLIVQPAYTTGTAILAHGSTAAQIVPGPTVDLTGYRIRFLAQSVNDVFIIQSHVPGNQSITLDSPYPGPAVEVPLQAMLVDYQLPPVVQVLASPMVVHAYGDRIYGVSPERMDELYPIPRLVPGLPQAFALETETKVRFSHGGRNDGQTLRIEYRYRPMVADLVDAISSIPLVPAQWMHVLSDMALVYILLDKNDDRSNAAALGARTVLAGMLKENRRRGVKVDMWSGHIFPRQHGLGQDKGGRGPLRTESGLIIG